MKLQMQCPRVRLKSAAVGVLLCGERRSVIKLPALAEITIIGPAGFLSQYWTVEWEGKTLELFGGDIYRGGDPIPVEPGSELH